MSQVNQQYLKDKDGNIFSPITSSDAVYLPESLGGGHSTNFLKQINEFIENYNKKHLDVSTSEKTKALIKLHVGSYSRFLIQVNGTINNTEALPIFTILKINIDGTGTQLLNFTPITIQGFNTSIQFNATISDNIVSIIVSNLDSWSSLHLQILKNKDSAIYFTEYEAI